MQQIAARVAKVGQEAGTGSATLELSAADIAVAQAAYPGSHRALNHA